MMSHWDPCTYIWSYLHALGSMLFTLGFMYYIGIHVTTLGYVTVHQGMTWTHHHTCHMDHSKLFSLHSSTSYSHLCIFIPFLDHMSEIFYTFEETIIGCWSSFKWLGWPLGDVALTTLIFFRNAHTEVVTRDTYHWIFSWISHTCKGYITSWELVSLCLDYSLDFGSWLEDHLGPWTIFDSPFNPWWGIGTFF